MLTHQQRRLGDYRLVKTHAPQNDRHVPRALGRMVAHARTFADIVQQAGQQQCRVLCVVVPHATRRLASKLRDDFDHMAVNRVPVRRGHRRPVAYAQPLRHPPSRQINEIKLLPHGRQRLAGGQEPNEQFASLVIPAFIADRALLEIQQR